MKEYRPYEIIHLALDKSKALFQETKFYGGDYVVIWWKEIALGQFFVEPGTDLTRDEYLNLVASAIQPSLLFYSNNTLQNKLDWKDWLLNHNAGEWNQKIATVLEGVNKGKFPATVPVSVIICTRNRAAYLNKCIECLNKSICHPEEIIVVDNAPSNDETYKVASKFDNVTYIKEPRKGLDIARNTGVKNANFSIVAFTDDDVMVHPLWVYQVWNTFNDSNIAAMTGLVIASELKVRSQYLFEKYWSFNRGYIDKIYDSNFFESTLKAGPPVWEIGAGANMAFRKSVFKETGYFNEYLDVGAAGCNGDSEMWYRILAKGNSIAYNPRAITYHEHRKDLKGLKKQIFNYMRGYTVAALLQQKMSPAAGYKKEIFSRLPRYYFSLITKGFPYKKDKFYTTFIEMKGIVSGLRYYYKNVSRLFHSSTNEHE